VIAFLAGCSASQGNGSQAGAGSSAVGARGGSAADAAAWAEPAKASMAPPACEALPFAESTPVPEVSGAAWLTIDGKPALVVVGDSGNHGAYGILDPETGATRETGRLPLDDGASDDLEGLAARGDRLYGLTSAGWMRSWRRDGHGFALVDPAYPLGPVDLPDDRNNNRAPAGDGMVCNAKVVNCGRNYEGLCLAPVPTTPGCIGFAASKADGHLYCLSEQAGKLVVHRGHAIEVARSGALADCAFADDGTLWAGSNMFDLGTVYRVARWDDPARAEVQRVGSLGVGFPEGIAARGDVVYRFSDMGGAPSLIARYRCRR